MSKQFIKQKSALQKKAMKQLVNNKILQNKLKLLEKSLSNYVEQHEIHVTSGSDDGEKYIIFISISDSFNRARVVHTSASSFAMAWKQVTSIAEKTVEKYNLEPTWVKADIVDKTMIMPFVKLKDAFLEKEYQKFFRLGFSLDGDFKYAFLEAEANSYKLYDYTVIPMKASKPGHDKVPCINIQQVEQYMKWNDRTLDIGIGEDVYFFNSQGFFCDESSEVYELYNSDMSCGRRINPELSKEFVCHILTTSSQYLTRQLKEDGSFIYGYYPSFNSMMKDYNILRHGGTLWAMMCAYEVTKDETLLPTIKSALDYLCSQIVYRDGKHAYLVEAKSKEIKLGGLGIAILAMTKYMELFDDRDYKNQVICLANGIISMQNQETGKLIHVLNSFDFSIKEEMRTVYYDGESSYALIKAYEISENKDFLEAARLSIDYFIKNNYVVYRDHWLAYAMNEFTKHVKEEKYITFALRNAWENRARIKKQETSYHTYLELLMETYDLYLRLIKEGLDIEYLSQIDGDEFLDIIKYRAWHMLDGYFYPEYAMYMSKPDTILGSFFVRHDGFRTRIDDDQHFIDGYAKYYKLVLK